MRPNGLALADQLPSHGSRPVSVTSTTHGPGKQLLYVLNSDTAPQASRATTSVPVVFAVTTVGSRRRAARRRSRARLARRRRPTAIQPRAGSTWHGRVLAVSERSANAGNGDIDIFPVDKHRAAGPPIVNASVGRTPYGLDWNRADILSVSNETVPAVAGSTVTTHALTRNGRLVPLGTAPSLGAACWNVFTNNGKFVCVTNPAGPPFGGANVVAFRVDHGAALTRVDTKNTAHNAIDEALNNDSKHLYVLSDQQMPAAPNSAINEFAIDPATGASFGSIELPRNTASGLAAW